MINFWGFLDSGLIKGYYGGLEYLLLDMCNFIEIL